MLELISNINRQTLVYNYTTFMAESNSEIIIKDPLKKFPISENITPKDKHKELLRLLGENLHNMGNMVKDESTADKTEKVVLQGTGEEIIHPTAKPFVLRSGARSGCDASLLLEVTDDGTARAAVTHWGPTGPERKAHTDTVQRLTEQTSQGTRFAILVSGTIKDLQEAEETDLYQKMTEWNGGRKPDLVYIPFEGIDWSKIARETLYQLVLEAKTESGQPQFKVSVPRTTYSKSFTPQTLQEVRNQEVASVKL